QQPLRLVGALADIGDEPFEDGFELPAEAGDFVEVVLQLERVALERVEWLRPPGRPQRPARGGARRGGGAARGGGSLMPPAASNSISFCRASSRIAVQRRISASSFFASAAYCRCRHWNRKPTPVCGSRHAASFDPSSA